MHCARAEESDKVTTENAPRQPSISNEVRKTRVNTTLCLYERERNDMPASSPSPLQETARALWFGFSTNIASTGWFLPWRSLMRLSAIQASRHSAIGDGGEMSLPLLHLLTGPNLGLVLSHNRITDLSDRTSSHYNTSLQGVFSDPQSPSNTENEHFTPTIEECVQDESDCCVPSPASPSQPPMVSPLQSSPVSGLLPPPALPPVPPPLPPLVPISCRWLPPALPITHFYSNKPPTSCSTATHTTSLFHTIEPLDASSVRAILRQRVGQKRKETVITELELGKQETGDDSSYLQKKKAKLDEPFTTESIEDVQIVPAADTTAPEHNTIFQYNSTEKCTQEHCHSNQLITCIHPEVSPKNEVGEQDATIPLLDSSFQSDSFHQVPGSPSNYTAEPQVVEDLFSDAADDVPKKKSTQDLNNASFQDLDSDNEEHTVPIELSVSEAQLYNRRLFLKKAYNNFNEPVEPTRLNLTKPRLRIGLSKKQRCRSLHHVPLYDCSSS